MLLFPVASLLGGSKAAQQGVLFGAMGLRGVAATNAFTSCIILVNSAAPPGSLGAVSAPPWGAGFGQDAHVEGRGPTTAIALPSSAI